MINVTSEAETSTFRCSVRDQARELSSDGQIALLSPWRETRIGQRHR
jgi:hypothetical protein